MTKIKICSRCKVVKPITEFYYDKGDGKLKYSCKECCRIVERGRTIKFTRKRRYNARRSHEYYIRNKARIKKLYKDNPQKIRAKIKANYHIKKYLPCEICGALKTEKHHDDYNKPLSVRFLCRRHHARLHGRLKIQSNIMNRVSK